jgi:prolyl-tRNA synthetase
VFDLGQKYGQNFDLGFTDVDGKKQYPVMGCYGIGVSRTMGVIVEKFHDAKGIIWPESVAPFRVHLIELGGASAAGLYEDLLSRGVEVLYDDRDASAGQKFADADLIGIPYRAVVSPKTEGKIEVKKRDETEAKLVPEKEFVKLIS